MATDFPPPGLPPMSMNAVASTARRHRTILANAADCAIELGLLDANPIRALKWTAPKVSGQIDRRSVVNPRQARALLVAVRAQQPSGPMLVAFFGVMYYAGLRPEEAINLRFDDIALPAQIRQGAQDDGEWGEIRLRSATPDAGGEWTDDGALATGASSSTAPKATAELCPSSPS